ncbi:endonuclease/exonuclease/phosphatase family protein [Thiohalospira sp.]|uniref:endonuclease/exonuclease/phosphatase family protein n=1 Tax=Thiohalospira sp. TaxID=3080549 RepID=UPI00397F4F3F
MRRVLLAALLLLVATPALAAELRIASWNVKHLGWDNDKHLPALARVAGRFDLVALQEVMGTEGVDELEAALEAESGAGWESLVSHELGDGRYKERYAFLWREAAIAYDEGAVVYVDDADRFLREPFSARFRARADDTTFVAATVHIRYGDSVADRTPEIRALRRYWEWLAEIDPETVERRLLMGDFNLEPDHAAWEPLTGVARPQLTEGASTLGTDSGWSKLYDNLFLPGEADLNVTGHGVLDFRSLLRRTTDDAWPHEEARSRVSDHAPVYILLDGAELHPVEGEDRPGRAQDAPACIDLNAASRQRLQDLPHIGPERARAIVDGRPWEGVEELDRIHGIGPAREADIRESGRACE